MESRAIISNSNKYRYELHRTWDIDNNRMIYSPIAHWEDGDINYNLNVEDFEFMQYTGLKDKSKEIKEVYESDLITDKYDPKLISEVVFKDGAFWQIVFFSWR